MSLHSEDSVLNLTEFDAPSQMISYYCQPVTEAEYAENMATNTESALKVWFSFEDHIGQQYILYISYKIIVLCQAARLYSDVWLKLAKVKDLIFSVLDV